FNSSNSVGGRVAVLIFVSFSYARFCQKYLPKILLTVNIFRQLCKFERSPLFSRFFKEVFSLWFLRAFKGNLKLLSPFFKL
ncbi:hypothetical protein KKC52_13460, partial [bacterium]|nr:hypothetical protein [bacterium]